MPDTPKHRLIKMSDAPRRGAAAARVVAVLAAVTVSVCAAVFTFWGMTAIETRLTDRNDIGGNIADAFEPMDIAGGETHTPADITPPPEEPPPEEPPRLRSSGGGNNKAAPAPPPSGPTVPYMIDNAPPIVSMFSLTFDGGSLANAAPDILDTLASRGVKSTMFLTGEFIRKHPQVVTRIASEGHELGNHTHKHPHLTSYGETMTHATLPHVTREFVEKELGGAAQTLADRTGLRFAPLWRAPYGEYNQQICKWALDAGYVHIGWRRGRTWRHSLDTNDWIADESHGGYRTPEQIYDKIIDIASAPGGLNGGIILMHLGTERKQRGQQAHIILGKLIDDLREMGYEPVKVSELLYRSGIDINELLERRSNIEENG